jgi:3-oxoacyl-[acyl-carrier-protein] synthase II
MVLGEGAAAIVLEELAHAEARSATIYGEVLGAGSSSVITPNGVARCDRALANAMRACLRAAGLGPAQIGHIHAHGLSTLKSDVEEAQAIGAVFGPDSRRIPVVAAKSYFGNLGAGGGVAELASSLMALLHGHLFPILNYHHADPECPIRAVRDLETPSGNAFLNVNTTPQGQASAVLIRRLDGQGSD